MNEEDIAMEKPAVSAVLQHMSDVAYDGEVLSLWRLTPLFRFVMP
jgi:hypothetical protein